MYGFVTAVQASISENIKILFHIDTFKLLMHKSFFFYQQELDFKKNS